MVMTDPVSDMLTRIRNANMAGHREVHIPASKLKAEIARVMKREGYIKSYELSEDGKQGNLVVTLRYSPSGDRILSGLRRESRPGRRAYCSKEEIPRRVEGLGIVIMSTPRGVMTGREAIRRGVGGELLCTVW